MTEKEEFELVKQQMKDNQFRNSCADADSWTNEEKAEGRGQRAEGEKIEINKNEIEKDLY